MDTLTYALADGGPATLIVVLLGLLAILLAPVPGLVFGFTRWSLPASLGWLGAVIVVWSGTAGTMSGMSQATAAIQEAPAEMQATLMAGGLSLALYSLSFALSLSSWSLAIAAMGTALPAPFRPGPDGGFDLFGLGGSLLGGAFGWLIALAALAIGLGLEGLRNAGVGAPLLLFWAVALGLPVLISAVVIDKEDASQRGRMAAIRVAVGAAGFLSLVLAGESWEVWGLVEATKAVATAPPEMRPMLLANGAEIAAYTTTIGWSLAPVPLLAGLGAAIPGLRDVKGRQLVGLGIAVLLAVTLLMGWVVADLNVRATLQLVGSLTP